MPEEIIVDIDERGNARIEGVGIVGEDCTRLTKAIEEAVGEVAQRTLKPEYRQTRTVGRKAVR